MHRLLNDGVNSYTYDSAIRLAALTGPSGTVTYAYNGLGDRLTQNGITYTLNLNAGLTQVLSDGTYTYLYGLDRIAQVDTSAEYFLGDALGSVRQMADAGGEVTYTRSYDPYGVVTAADGASQTAYGFTGEYQDNAGMVYLRARHYEPGMGRFLTRDTWGGNVNMPVTYNKWAYANANPIMNTDPTGYFSIKPSRTSIIRKTITDILPGHIFNLLDDCLFKSGNMLTISTGSNYPDWFYYLAGAATQYIDDLSIGIYSKYFLQLDNINNAKFQEGRNLGHGISLTQAMIETTIGLLAIDAAITSIPPTLGGGLVCELASGGLCTLALAPAIAGEVAIGAIGAGLTVHGAAMAIHASEGGGGSSGGGGSGGSSASNKINITKAGEHHVLERHAINGRLSSGKSVFNQGENIMDLIKQAEHITPTPQANGYYQRIANAGRIIGVDRVTGLPTSTYTVITTSSGNLVTAFPGLP